LVSQKDGRTVVELFEQTTVERVINHLKMFASLKDKNSVKIRRLHHWLLSLALLITAAVGGGAQQPGVPPSGEAVRQKAKSYLFVSPNTSENLTLGEALRKLNSREEIALILNGRGLACRLGLKARIDKTIGSWTDGVEHSTMLRIETDEDAVRYTDAWLGRRARQKSVLYFRQHSGGAARMYILSLRGHRPSLSLIAATLERGGVSNRTLVPGAGRTLVYVVDLRNELRQQIAAAARQLGAGYVALEGAANFIGDDSDRDKAQQIFSDIIVRFEKERPPVNNRCGASSIEPQPSRMSRSKAVSIAEARLLPPGTTTMIEGTVTVPSGTFKASVADEGFAVQDESGGIYVSMSANAGLRVGERVRVTGRLMESMGTLVIAPAEVGAIERRGAASQVKPLRVKTGGINESTEGRLVRVEGIITKPIGNDMPYGFRIFINDGTGEVQVFVSASTGIETGGLQAGQRLSVTGLSGQYKDHYEVSPRFASDINRRRRERKRRPAP
jgi:hypothetical protein